MIIQANSWHCWLFQFSWQWLHIFNDASNNPPANTNLCQYTKYLIFSPLALLSPVFVLLVISIIYLVFFIVGFVVGPFFGISRPKNFTISCVANPLFDWRCQSCYKGDTRIKTTCDACANTGINQEAKANAYVPMPFRGVGLWILFVIYLIYKLYGLSTAHSTDILSFAKWTGIVLLALGVGVILGLILFKGIEAFLQMSIWGLIAQRWRDFKDKTCTLITIEGLKTKNSVDKAEV